MSPEPRSVVWISGASAGIGRALVDSVPWDSAKVVGISRHGFGAAFPSNPHASLESDLSDPAAWDEVAASFIDEVETGLESAIFIHAAATITPMGFVGEVDSRAYRRAVMLNSVAPQVLGDAFLHAVNRAGVRSQLLMVTSGTSPYPGWAAYKAGKAAVDAWVRAAGAGQTDRQAPCRVIAVAPGYVETAMQETIRSSDPSDFPQRAKFEDAKHKGLVRDAADVARDFWALVADPDIPNGAIVDLTAAQ